MTKRVSINFLVMIFMTGSINGLLAQKASIRETTQTLMTYPYSDPDPVPVFGTIYPYFRFDGYAAEGHMEPWKMVEMENEYIKLWVTPDIGGKIWGAVDKKTGKEFLYFNHAVKFRDIAMRGPWTSGGLEINFGVIGHAPTCSSPVDYFTRINPDSSVSCFVGALDLPSGTEWRVEIRLPRDRAEFLTRVLWYNGSPLEQSYYQWMNAAEKTAGNLQYTYPGSYYLGHNGSHASFPVDENGRKISFYENNNFGPAKSYHVAGVYTGFFGGYWHDDDFGFGHYSAYDEKPGKKIWIWGLSRSGMIWENLLTDKDGQYTEIQSGRLFNQSASESSYTPFKHRNFDPFLTDVWTEAWFPVHGTKGITYSSSDLTVNILKEGTGYTLYLYSIGTINDQLKVYSSGEKIVDRPLSMKPEDINKLTLPVNQGSPNWKIILGNDIVFSSGIEDKKLNRPVELPEDFNFNSTYGLYLRGKEWDRQRHYDSADYYYHKCLQTEPYYSPALNGLAGIQYRRMDYAKALKLLETSLSVDTYDPAANYLYGLTNISLGNDADALDGFSIASQSAEFRTAAFTQLALYFTGTGEFDKARDYLTKSLLYNRHNLLALDMTVMISRLQGKRQEAENEIGKILYSDPLNHFAQFEKFLLDPDSVHAAEFRNTITNELAYETYLRLAITYYRLKQYTTALNVLSLSPRQPLVLLWEAYLEYLSGHEDRSKEFLNRAAEMPSDFVFPYRSEDEPVLLWAMDQNHSWKFKYYDALLYAHMANKNEAIKLLNDCGDEPEFYPFYVVRAELQTDKSGIEKDLKQAFNIDPGWRTRLLLAKFYAAQNRWGKADSLLETYVKANSADYITGLFYAKCLLHLKRFDEGLSWMSQLQVLPNEGATEGRLTWRTLALNSALDKIEKHNYRSAIEKLQLSKKWPENLGVGRPYEVDERLEDFMLSWCYEQTGNKKTAATFTEKTYAGVLIPGYVASSAGDLISAIALRKSGRQQEAGRLMNSWKESDPDTPLRQWCETIYHETENDQKNIRKTFAGIDDINNITGTHPDLGLFIRFLKLKN